MFLYNRNTSKEKPTVHVNPVTCDFGLKVVGKVCVRWVLEKVANNMSGHPDGELAIHLTDDVDSLLDIKHEDERPPCDEDDNDVDSQPATKNASEHDDGAVEAMIGQLKELSEQIPKLKKKGPVTNGSGSSKPSSSKEAEKKDGGAREEDVKVEEEKEEGDSRESERNELEFDPTDFVVIDETEDADGGGKANHRRTHGGKKRKRYRASGGERIARIVPSASFTLHSTKLCSKFKIFRKKIFFLTKVISETFLSISRNLKVTSLQGCTQTKL